LRQAKAVQAKEARCRRRLQRCGALKLGYERDAAASVRRRLAARRAAPLP
jgi:hypothetical protein